MRQPVLAALAVVALPLLAARGGAQSAEPSDGAMLGIGRTTNARGLADYELTLIRQDGARLLYEAHPKGQPSATFVARAVALSR